MARETDRRYDSRPGDHRRRIPSPFDPEGGNTMSDYAGRKVLVTGAANGLGRLMALAIAAEGGELILWALNRTGADAVRLEIARAGRTGSCTQCDLADRLARAVN